MRRRHLPNRSEGSPSRSFLGSYWATLGYDTESIETNTHEADKMKHPVLGQTYRVCIVEAGETATSGQCKKEKHVAKKKGGG